MGNSILKDKIYYYRKIRQNGYKLTLQRTEIIRALLELNHPTVNEILKMVHQQYPSIQPLTIYRTLELLEEINELRCIDLQQENRYELTDTTHPHFVCEETGKVRDVEDPEIERKLIKIKELVKKDVRRVELNIYYSCTDDASYD